MPAAILEKLRMRRTSRRSYVVPGGTRFYAIGDVHGCLDELERMLDAIAADLAGRAVKSRLILLGDLVDRGPNSSGVIERLLNGAIPTDDLVCLLGNHEEAMLACFGGSSDIYGTWLSSGGLQTLESYGITRPEIFSRSFDVAAAMRAAIPAEHIHFILSFRDYVHIGDYLFVHAGIRPGVSLEQQASRDLRWIRAGFLNNRTRHDFMVVHGHTIVPEVERRSNRIALDTGCYLTGELSALALEGNTLEILRVGKE
jgi:serine/threonine protein phosphatase 1